jgi:Tfp pilus assembly protein PilF
MEKNNMSLLCKSCGAPSNASASLFSFICDYCGTKNVDPEYLKQYASKIDIAKANHSFQLGLVAIKSEDFKNAEKHLEASVLEDANNSESWVYLALSKVALIKPSNYEKYYDSAIQCLNKAKLIQPDSDIYLNGSILVQSKLLETSTIGASYFIDTAYKKNLAYSGSSQAISAAGEEATKGLGLINNAYQLGIANAELASKALVYAAANCIEFKNKIGNYGDIEDKYKFYIAELNKIYIKRRDLVENELNLFTPQKSQIQKSLDKLSQQNNVLAANNANSSDNSSLSNGINKNLLIVAVAGVIVAGIYFISGEKKTAVSSNPSNISGSSQVSSPAKSETPVSVIESSSENKIDASCNLLDECVKKSLLAAVSEDVDSVRKLATFIDQIPKPDQGNRPISRKLNSEALELLRKNDFDSAVNIFKSAVKENPKDVEINSNLGFALVKGGRYKEAIAVLHNSLILDPRRTSTWTPLAEAYALDNKQNEALASMWIGLQWSADREKSVSYYAERIEKEKNDRPQLFELYKSILDWANGKKPDIRI